MNGNTASVLLLLIVAVFFGTCFDRGWCATTLNERPACEPSVIRAPALPAGVEMCLPGTVAEFHAPDIVLCQCPPKAVP